MTILTMPSAPGFKRSRFGLRSASQTFTSPLNGATQTLEITGARWMCSYELPPMKRDLAVAWQAFLLKLRGKAGRFYGFDPDAKTPRGVASTVTGTTNKVRNGDAAGAVAGFVGTTGQLPSNWNRSSAAGLTWEILGSGTEANGVGYVDIRLSGTTAATNLNLRTESITQIAALVGQVFTSSFYVALIAGSMANITAAQIQVDDRDAAGASLANSAASFTPNSSFTRVSHVRTVANAATAYVTEGFALTFSSGVAINATFRIGGGQVEPGATLNAYLPTTGTERSRATGTAIDGAGQTGTVLSLMGMGASVSNILKAGDYLHYDTSAGRQLHMIMADCNSNGIGEVTVTVEPPIRTSPADGAAVTLQTASCVMGLTSDEAAAWDVDAMSVYGLSFEAEERF